MTVLDRLRDAWASPLTRAVLRFLAAAGRAAVALIALVIRQLRLVWWGFTARGRIFLIIGGLVGLSALTSAAAPSLAATAQGLAVLLLAFVGLWVVLTSPFRSRRW